MRIIHLLDYGVGNIGSLNALLERLNFVGILTSDPETVKSCPVLLLPGVGSAVTALREIESRGLLQSLRERHARTAPMVGICLGSQLLFSHLDEAQQPGFGFLPGTVSPLSGDKKFNVGWSRLEWRSLPATRLSRGLKEEDSFFFNHQYKLPLSHGPGVVPLLDRKDIPAMFMLGHLCGLQFHPEKSQSPGIRLMGNILEHYYE